MTVAAAVNEAIRGFKPGEIFGCEDLPQYREAPEAVARALSRLAAQDKLKRLSKGQYYVPKRGVLGSLKPADSELLRRALYRKGQLNGYVTGAALYNQLGLTTQVPRTITLATNGARKVQDFGTIRIKSVPSRAPVRQSEVLLLQYLDAIRDIKRIPDSNPDDTADSLAKRLSDLPEKQRERLQKLALNYYNASTRALLGLLLTSIDVVPNPELRQSLNPLSRYAIGLSKIRWPNKLDWAIE
jgi:hypothetical protein